MSNFDEIFTVSASIIFGHEAEFHLILGAHIVVPSDHVRRSVLATAEVSPDLETIQREVLGHQRPPGGGEASLRGKERRTHHSIWRVFLQRAEPTAD